MPRNSPWLATAICAPLLLAASLAGCTTTVKPKTSQAVLDARAQAVARRGPAPAASVTCAALPPLALATSGKLEVLFPFQETGIGDTAGAQLDAAAKQLVCHPAQHVAVTGEADHHGAPQDQKALIAQRIDGVRQRLSAEGVAPAQFIEPASAGVGDLTILARGRDW